MSPARFAVAFAVLLVAGCLIAAIGTTVALDATGATLGGFAGVGLVACAFYAIGRSEDRQRERDEAERGRRPSP
jgi:4-hydroxybenzoate polyprenyltransferase